jgi:hypothetical protein
MRKVFRLRRRPSADRHLADAGRRHSNAVVAQEREREALRLALLRDYGRTLGY